MGGGKHHCYVIFPHQCIFSTLVQKMAGLAGNFRVKSLIRSRVGVMPAILVSREQEQLVWRRAAHLHTAAQRNISSIVRLRCTPCRSRQSCLYLFMPPLLFRWTIKLQIQDDTHERIHTVLSSITMEVLPPMPFYVNIAFRALRASQAPQSENVKAAERDAALSDCGKMDRRC